MESGESRSLIERFALRTTAYIGSPASLLMHTALFAFSFALPWFGIPFDRMLLVVTTIVSLEAIYLSIFIQMTVNRHSLQMEEVSEDVEEISEDVGDIQENVEEISKDIDDIQEDVEDLSEDVEDLSEDVEEISEEIGVSDEEETPKKESGPDIERIESALEGLLKEVRSMRSR